MPIHATINKNSGVAVITCEGRVASHELTKFYESLENHNTRPMEAILDLSAAELSVSAKYIRVLATRKAVFKRIAIVAPEPCTYGLSRMYELLSSEKQEVRVFRHQDQAQLWLASRGNVRLK
jgi:hypothetical protein